jgi:hypothetical protein
MILFDFSDRATYCCGYLIFVCHSVLIKVSDSQAAATYLF